MNITWKGSPNFDGNRKPIRKIIIHWFGDSLTTHTGIEAAYKQFQKANGTSAHYAVENTTVYQFVKEDDVAYHAGNYAVNQESIGIEHSAGPKRSASDATYETSSTLIAEISKRHNIPLDRQHVLKHSEVKATQCCGTIDIDKLITMAKSKLGGGCEEKIEELEKQVDEIRDSRDKWKLLHKEDTEKLAEEIKQKNLNYEALQKTLSETNATHTQLLTSLENELKISRAEVQPLKDEKDALKSKLEASEEVVKGKSGIILEREKDILDLKETIKKQKAGLKGFSKWDLLLALMGR